MRKARSYMRVFMRLFGLVSVLSFLCVPAKAQGDAVLPPMGGYGGGQFVARCSDGQHLTGFQLRTGDDVDAIRPLCVIARGPKESGSIQVYPSSFGGDGGGHDVRILCPKDTPIVIGLDVGFEGRATTIVNNIHLYCGIASSTQVVSEFPSAVFDGPNIVPGHFIEDTQRCPAGLVAVGINGRSGKWLDAVGLICGVPTLTPDAPVPVKPPVEANLPAKTLGRINLVGPAFIYALGSDGALKWFRHDGASVGKFDWQGPRVVNTGWNNFKQVFPGGADTIYAITRQGVLIRYQHTGFKNGLGRDDANAWLPPQEIATGFGNFTRVFSTGNGVIYAITFDGKLRWFKHTGFANGKATWEGPRDVGRGWGDLKQVFSMGDGIIYTITNDGKLNWLRHNGYLYGDGLDRPDSWTGPKQVGTGWGEFTQVFSTGDGIIYGITPAGKLMWFNHRGYKQGTFVWDGPKEVGKGWENLAQVFAQPQ